MLAYLIKLTFQNTIKNFFIITLFISSGAWTNEPFKYNPPHYDVAISLGSNCQVAWQLKLNFLRKEAFPFDFVLTPLEGVIYFIVNKGQCFLEGEKLIYIGLIAGTPHVHAVDTTYRIEFLHDFIWSHDCVCNYPEVKSKYERRSQRFFNLLKSDKKILFIRLGISYEQAVYLDYTLHTLYPHLNYTILALDNTEEIKYNWGLERVKNVYLPQLEPYIWSGDCQAWQNILNLFSIDPYIGKDCEDY